MVPLNEYEARQADEIAEWKSERPSLVMAAFRGMSRPLSRLASKVIPRETIRSILDRAETISQKLDGREEIARKAGVSDVRELGKWTLEESDRLAASISAPAERLALIDGAVAGIGGVVTETLNVPLLLAATLRSIIRIGHCYGYTLDSEIDRLFVLGILELSTADEPERRQELFQQLEQLGPAGLKGRSKKKQVDLDGVRTAMLEDLAFGAVPILGDLTSILMDYDFVRRVDITARRVFQERWLKDHGKVEKIYPAPVSRRRSSVDGVADLLAQLTYVGTYGVAFGVTLPLAFVARKAAVFDNALVRGFKQGAADATGDADRFLSEVRAGAKSAQARASGAPAPGLSVFPAA